MGSEFDDDDDLGDDPSEEDEDEDEEKEEPNSLLSLAHKIGPPVEEMKDYREETALEPLDKLMLAQDKIGQLWQTGMVQIHIYRDHPTVDSKGNHIAGKVATVGHKIESDWFEKTVGGGTYHVKIHGPSKNSKGRPVLGGAWNIVIAGKPFIENKYPPEDDPPQSSKKSENDGVGDAMARLLRMQDDQSRRQEKRMEEMQKQLREEAELARRKSEKEQGSSFEMFQRMLDAQKTAAREAEEKYGDIMDKLLRTVNDPGKEAAVRAQMESAHEAMRQSSEQHSAAIRELNDRHREEISRLREDYLGQVNTARSESATYVRELRDTHDSRERALRDEFDRRERDVREAASMREQAIRDDFERRIEMLRELANREEKTLRDQLAEVKDELRSLKDAKSQAERDAAEARYDKIRAEMSVAKAQENPGGMLGLAKSMEEFQAVAALMGLGKNEGSPEPDIFAQVATILNTEPAKRVGAGIAGLLQGLGQRGAAGAQAAAQMAPFTPPPDSALAAWNAAQAQMHEGEEPQVIRRMRRRPPAQTAAQAQVMAAQSGPVVDSSLPETYVQGVVSAPETVSEQQERQAAEQQAEEQQVAVEQEITPEAMASSAATLLDLLDAAMNASKTPEAVLEEVTPFLGGDGAMQIIINTPEADLFGRVEEALRSTKRRLSVMHKRYLRQVLEAARRKYGSQ